MDKKSDGVATPGRGGETEPRRTAKEMEGHFPEGLELHGPGQKPVVHNTKGGRYPNWMQKATVRQ